MIGKEKAIGVGAVAVGIAIYENSEYARFVVDWTVEHALSILEESSLLNKAQEIGETYNTSTIIAGILLGGIAKYGYGHMKNYLTERQFNKKDYRNMINISVTWIESDGVAIIENESEDHIDEMLPRDKFINRALKAASKKVDSDNIVIPFKDDTQGWDVYGRIRSHPNFFAERISVLEKATRAKLGKKIEEVEFIGVFTHEPQFTVSEEKKVAELSSQSDIPHTKAEIRLLVFPEIEIKDTINWIELTAKKHEITFDEVIDALCTDNNDCCDFVNEYIWYMLDEEGEKDKPEEVTEKLKWPTYRKRFVALAHVAREYYQEKPHLKVGYQV